MFTYDILIIYKVMFVKRRLSNLEKIIVELVFRDQATRVSNRILSLIKFVG